MSDILNEGAGSFKSKHILNVPTKEFWPGAAGAWRNRAGELAVWVQANLVNRADAYGYYYPESAPDKGRRKCGNAKRDDTLTSAKLVEHFTAALNTHERVGLYSYDAAGMGRWLNIDIDAHGDVQKENWHDVVHVLGILNEWGIKSIVEHSNGKCGFKLWVVFDTPQPIAELRAVGLYLTAGLEKTPEVFPKQATPTPYGSYVRLPGRHHKEVNWWSEFYDVDRAEWVRGEHAPAFLLAQTPNDAGLLPAEAKSFAVPKPERARDYERREGSTGGDEYDFAGDLSTLDVEGLVRDAGLYVGRNGNVIQIVCPWADEHTTGDHAYAFDNGAGEWPGFTCHHAHCSGRGFIEFLNTFPAWAVDARCSKKYRPHDVHDDDAVHRIVGNHDDDTAAEPKGGTTAEDKFEDAAGPKDGTTAGAKYAPRRIIINDRQLRDVVRDTAAAVKEYNSPPTWFKRGDAVVQVNDGDIRHGGADAVKMLLSKAADWYHETKGKNGPTCVAKFPHDDIVKSFVAEPGDALPGLAGVIRTPVFTAGGRLLHEAGYDAETKLLLAPNVTVDVPENPTADDVVRAAAYIQTELFSDFPFAGDGDKAHAVALLLLPFVRQLIGPTPIHAVDAPSEGTGKGLLMDVCSVVWTGEPKARTTAEPRDESEWDKTIVSELMTNPGYVLFDNVSKQVQSPALASALTTGIHKGRLLGQSKMLALPVNCVWAMTGNNIKASREIARRIVRIRLDADCENPNLRTNFRHPNLIKWAAANRAKIVSACLTIIKGWMTAGMPVGKYTLGSYEDWAGTMGGILDFMRVPGFLSNLHVATSAMNTADAEYHQFINLWFNSHGNAPVTAGQLLKSVDSMADSIEFKFLEVKPGGSRSIKLGMVLANLVGRVFGANKVTKSELRSKVYGFRLVNLNDANRPSGPSNGRNGAPDCGVAAEMPNSAATPHPTPQNLNHIQVTTYDECCGVAELNPTLEQSDRTLNAYGAGGGDHIGRGPDRGLTPQLRRERRNNIQDNDLRSAELGAELGAELLRSGRTPHSTPQLRPGRVEGRVVMLGAIPGRVVTYYPTEKRYDMRLDLTADQLLTLPEPLRSRLESYDKVHTILAHDYELAGVSYE